MAAAGLAVSCAMLLCLEGSPRKLKTLIQLHAQPPTAIPKEQAPSMGKAPKADHLENPFYIFASCNDWFHNLLR